MEKMWAIDDLWIILSPCDPEFTTTYNMFFQAEIFLQVELHPKYDNVSSYYDIGLIYTDKDINFNSDGKPICLSHQPNPDVNFLASKSVHMAGWGRVTDQSNARRNELTLRQEYINHRTVSS
jgi:hypothetical protein